MHIPQYADQIDGGSCTLDYDKADGWLRATWLGYIGPDKAYEGAAHFLDAMQDLHCPYLLNDNSQISGPWFDSVEWLRGVWAPQSVRLGLRYIAHVVQPYDLAGEVAGLPDQPFGDQLTLQLFDTVESAEEWLRALRSGQENQG